MSSLRNAISRRPHKERSQPTTRTKYGLLEKHKDYSLRAADYNAKKQKLDILQQKTRDRHPDEFAFGMVSKDKKQGKHGRRGEEENRLGVEKVRLLKGQDAGYLRVVAGRTRREVERVREETILSKRGIGEGNGTGKGKVVFGEDGEPERKKRRVSRDQDDEMLEGEGFNPEEHRVNTHDTVATPIQTSNPPTTATTTTTTKAPPKPLSTKQAQKHKDKLSQLKADRKHRKRLQDLRAAKLKVLKKRQKEIMAAADQLDLQRAKMAGVVGGVNRDGVRFKVRERKR